MLLFETTLANFGAIASIVGVILAVATLVFFMRPRSSRFLSGSASNDEPIPKANRAPAPVPTQTTIKPALPNPSLRLQQMLESAQSVRSFSDRGEALRLVAEHAVSLGAYKKAIEAGEADPSHSGKSDTLKFVAISAARAGSFEEAVRAAKKIPSYDSQGETTKKILEIQSKLETDHLKRH